MLTDPGAAAPGPTGMHRVVQVHPTRRCNLRCLHCYSSSGPEVRETLPEQLLRQALEDAAAEQYTVAGFSGGEPLLYRPLAAVLQHARELGLTTTVTSNGTTLTDRRLEALQGRADLLAISLDGEPGSHNRMRGSATAFARLRARLPAVRRSGIPFGFIFTLTQYNVNELEWVASFAEEEGAGLLQIHPLEIVGRAAVELPSERPDETEASFAVLELVRLQERYAGRLHVHLDIADTRRLRDDPSRSFIGGRVAGDEAQPLAELLSPLVIESSGRVAPLQYGFPVQHTLGNLHRTRLSELARTWRHTGLARFRAVCEAAHDDLTAEGAPRFVNWYEAVTARAQDAREPVPA